jgi:hypothetical protein
MEQAAGPPPLPVPVLPPAPVERPRIEPLQAAAIAAITKPDRSALAIKALLSAATRTCVAQSRGIRRKSTRDPALERT